MRDFIYDLRRTLTGKFTIIAMAFIIIVSVGIGYAFTVNAGSQTTPTLNLDHSYTYSNGTYNVTFFAFNGNGQPASTLPVYLEYNNTTISDLSTDSNGFLNYTVHSNSSVVDLLYSLQSINASNPSGLTMRMTNNPAFVYPVQLSLTQITKPGTTNTHELVMYYAPTFANDTSQNLYVYYRLYNLTGSQSTGSVSLNNLTLFTQFTVSSVGTHILYINPPNRSATQAVEIFVYNSTNASSAVSLYIQPPFLPQGVLTTVGVASLSFEIFSALFGVFIPILASLSAYYYYGKDKTSGVLESVITRPVTKGRIILSRYIANVGSLILAFAIGTALFNIFLYQATGTALTAYYAGSLIWTYFVEITAYTGIIYFVSQFLKSQGAILGVAIGLFVVFGLLWTGLLAPLILTYVFHAVAGTNAYQQYTIYLDIFNPSGYSSLMSFLISPIGLVGGTIDAAKFGVTQLTVTITGVLWVVIPILVSYVIGRRRD